MWNNSESDTNHSKPNTSDWEPKTDRSRTTAEATQRDTGVAKIGKSICVRGELTGNEDLIVEGKVEGKIDLSKNCVTVGSGARIKAEITAKAVVVMGEVVGDVSANDRIELSETSKVEGDVAAPRVVIADGARFKGTVDTTSEQAQTERRTSVRESKKDKRSASNTVEAAVAEAERPALVGV